MKRLRPVGIDSMKKMLWTMVIILCSSVVMGADLDQLTSQLKSSDENVRYEAVAGLGDLADPQAIPELKKLLKDPSMLVRHGAVESLVQIDGPEVERIFQEIAQSGNIEWKRLGAVGLGLIGCSEESFQLLLQMTGDVNWQVRWASAYGLGSLGDSRAESVLQLISKTDSNEEVRKAAQQSLEKIKSQTRWYHSLEEALRSNQKEKKFIFVLFQIPNSIPSKMLKNQILSQPQIIDRLRNFVCVRMNPKVSLESVEKYRVQGVPTILLLDDQGALRDRMDGLIEIKQFEEKIKKWSEGLKDQDVDQINQKWILANELLDAERFAEAVPLMEELVLQGRINAQVLLYLGYSYGKLGQHSKAVEILERLLKEYPDFKEKDKGMYCLSLSYLALGRLDQAQSTLKILKDQYHELPTGQVAETLLLKIEEKKEK